MTAGGAPHEPEDANYDRIGTIAATAEMLTVRLGAEMEIGDGMGLGEVLLGMARVAGVGEVGFECPNDPHYPICMVYSDSRDPNALTLVCSALGLGTDAIVQLGS